MREEEDKEEEDKDEDWKDTVEKSVEWMTKFSDEWYLVEKWIRYKFILSRLLTSFKIDNKVTFS